MTFTDALTAVLRFLEPTWLTGPLLDKELRTAGRRRRTYVIRVGYLAGMMIFIAIAWASAAAFRSGGSNAYMVSRMPQIGRQVTCFIVWFQFITAQLIIIASLCSSLSDEITKRTLDVLLTTPVTAWQVVAGKFLSRCYQVMVLIALSLPVLAIIRVFGGVSWHYVVASLLVTLAAMVFAGALSLLGSVFLHRSHRCIMTVVGALLILYVAPWVLLNSFFGFSGSVALALDFITQRTNPFAILSALTASEFWVDPAGVNLPWGALCKTLAAGALACLLTAIIAVRFQVQGSLAILHPKNWFLGPRARFRELTGIAAEIRPVKGQAIFWKDMRQTLWGRGRFGRLMLFFISLLVALFYSWGFLSNWVAQQGFHFTLSSILSILCLLRAGAAAAASITGEKEARTLESLLTTPLDESGVIWGKALAALGRAGPLLIWLLVHQIAFAVIGIIEPFFVVLAILSLLGNLALVISVGLYFSARLKTTMAALIASFVTSIVFLYFCCGLLTGPFTLFTLRGGMSAGPRTTMIYGIMFIGPVVHGVIGLLFYTRAVANLRKRL